MFASDKARIEEALEMLGAEAVYEIEGQPHRLIATFATRENRADAYIYFRREFSVKLEIGTMAMNVLSDDPSKRRLVYTLDISDTSS